MPPMFPPSPTTQTLPELFTMARQGACRHGVNRQGIERFREQLLGDSF